MIDRIGSAEGDGDLEELINLAKKYLEGWQPSHDDD